MTKNVTQTTTKRANKNLLEKIANEHLGIETLEPQNSDRSDFHEVSVAGIAAALEAAYQAGRKSVR